MEILKISKKLWIFTGFYYDENTSIVKRFFGIFINIFIVVWLTMVIVVCVLYIYFNDELITESLLNVGYESVTAAVAVITFVELSLKKEKIVDLTRSIEEEVNRRINFKTVQIYENAEKYSECATKFPIIYSIILYDIAFPTYIVINYIYERINNNVNVKEWFNIYVFW